MKFRAVSYNWGRHSNSVTKNNCLSCARMRSIGKQKNNPLIPPISHFSKKYYVWDKQDERVVFGI